MNMCEHVVKLINYMKRNEVYIEGASYDAEYEIYCGQCDEFINHKLDVASVENFGEDDEE
jgi:hypothetical protein